MRRRGGGAIVNVGSTSLIGHGRQHSKSTGYDVAKAGVIRLVTGETLAGRVMIWWNGQPPRTMRASQPKSEWPTSPSIAAASYPMNCFEKREYAARTIRPKVHRLLPEYLRPVIDLAGSHQRPRLTIRCGTPRKRRCASRAGSTGTTGCTGQENCRMVSHLPGRFRYHGRNS